jgi:hypothetical protein
MCASTDAASEHKGVSLCISCSDFAGQCECAVLRGTNRTRWRLAWHDRRVREEHAQPPRWQGGMCAVPPLPRRACPISIGPVRVIGSCCNGWWWCESGDRRCGRGSRVPRRTPCVRPRPPCLDLPIVRTPGRSTRSCGSTPRCMYDGPWIQGGRAGLYAESACTCKAVVCGAASTPLTASGAAEPSAALAEVRMCPRRSPRVPVGSSPRVRDRPYLPLGAQPIPARRRVRLTPRGRCDQSRTRGSGGPGVTQGHRLCTRPWSAELRRHR